MVLRRVQSAYSAGRGGDERVIAGLVGREVPVHRTGETVVGDVLGFELHDVGGVVRDPLPLGAVVRVGRPARRVLVDLGAGDCEYDQYRLQGL